MSPEADKLASTIAKEVNESMAKTQDKVIELPPHVLQVNCEEERISLFQSGKQAMSVCWKDVLGFSIYGSILVILMAQRAVAIGLESSYECQSFLECIPPLQKKYQSEDAERVIRSEMLDTVSGKCIELPHQQHLGTARFLILTSENIYVFASPSDVHPLVCSSLQNCVARLPSTNEIKLESVFFTISISVDRSDQARGWYSDSLRARNAYIALKGLRRLGGSVDGTSGKKPTSPRLAKIQEDDRPRAASFEGPSQVIETRPRRSSSASAIQGWIPLVLHDAIKSRNRELIRKLLQKASRKGGGVDVNERDEFKQTPLHLAAQGLDPDVVEWLVKAGADVSAQDKNGWTPLHSAANMGNLPICETILRAHVDVLAVTSDGTTALHYLVRATEAARTNYEQYISVLSLIIELGADLNARNRNGDTPLHQACARRNKASAHFLLRYPYTDINALNRLNETPLHVCVRIGAIPLVQVLIGNGCDLHVPSPGIGTPEELAERIGDEDMVELLSDGALYRSMVADIRDAYHMARGGSARTESPSRSLSYSSSPPRSMTSSYSDTSLRSSNVMNSARDVLRRGEWFLKHGRRGAPHMRFVCLSENGLSLMWREQAQDTSDPVRSPRDSNSLALLDVKEVVMGHRTMVFMRSGKPEREELAFSVITRDRALNLEANSRVIRDDWARALSEVCGLNSP